MALQAVKLAITILVSNGILTCIQEKFIRIENIKMLLYVAAYILYF
jgi:hypothetical protein